MDGDAYPPDFLKDWTNLAQEKVSVLGGREDLYNIALSLIPFLTAVDCKQLNQKELLAALTVASQVLAILFDPSKKLHTQRKQLKVRKIYSRFLMSNPYVFSALFFSCG